MKKLLTIIATAFIALSVSAQSEAGSFTLQPNVGFTYASPSFGDGLDGAFALTAGVEGMYMINDKLGAALGLNYTGYNTSKEFKVKGESDDYIYSNYYFHIPVTANYYVAPGLAVKAGIAFNILSTAKFHGEDKVGKEKVKDWYKSTFFSIPVGVSYEINDFVLDARYGFGITDAAEGSNGSFNTLTFTVGYKF